LSAESANLNGMDAYLITFTNNDLVYVGMDGQILSVQVAPVVVSMAPAPPPAKKNRNNRNGGGGGDKNTDRDEHDD